VLLLRFDVLEVVGGWSEAAVRPIMEDAGFECVFDEAPNITRVSEQSWERVVVGIMPPVERRRMLVWRTARAAEEANWATDVTHVGEAILYKVPFATRADLRLKEKLDPGSSGKSLQQPNCLSKRKWLVQLHLGRCMLFQKVLSIASAAVGYVGLPSALG
jgi:hypothetical protein